MARKKKTAEDGAEEPKAGGSKRKRLLIVLIVLVAAAGSAYAVLGKGGDAKAAEKPKPGAVATLEAIHINLADGRYLKLGLALQATAKVKEAPDGSKALDIAIGLFSGRSLEEVNDPKERAKLKKELKEKVGEAYEHEVMDVYFTEFVTQ